LCRNTKAVSAKAHDLSAVLRQEQGKKRLQSSESIPQTNAINRKEDMPDPAPTDGSLMVQLAQWGTMLGLQDAGAVIFADEFDAEIADHRNQPIRTVLNWGETLGTMTKNHLISEQLILDWIWVAGLWDRVGPAARKAREQSGEPRLYENFETLASRQPA
jgi:hypothetical protein